MNYQKAEQPNLTDESVEEFDFDKIPSLDELMHELEQSIGNDAQTSAKNVSEDASSGNHSNTFYEVSPTDVFSDSSAVQASAVSHEEVTALRAELEQSRREHQDLMANFVRAQADFENFRKRIDRERTENYRHALSVIVTRLLPVLDNFERAIANVANQPSEKSTEITNFLNGIELIYRQMGRILEEMGIEPIATVGESFDPAIHEAVATEPHTDLPPNTVVEEIVRGYQMGDKLIRPAMVKVTVASAN